MQSQVIIDDPLAVDPLKWDIDAPVNAGMKRLIELTLAIQKDKRWKKYLQNTTGLVGFATHDVRIHRANHVRWAMFLLQARSSSSDSAQPSCTPLPSLSD